MVLRDDQIRRFALECAEAVFGAANIEGLEVSAGPDWSGTSAYFLDFVVEQSADREIAVDARLRLRREIREKLVAAGDETYPYVRIHNRALAPAVG